MTLNDPEIEAEWSFSVKICFGLGIQRVGVSGFRTKLFENLQRYPYTVSDKKCSLAILVSSKVRLCGYSRGFAGKGASIQMRVGSSKMAIIRFFTRYISQTFTPKATVIILCYVADSPLRP